MVDEESIPRYATPKILEILQIYSNAIYFILLKFDISAILLCFSADATLLFMISMSVLRPAGECEKPLKQDNHTKLNNQGTTKVMSNSLALVEGPIRQGGFKYRSNADLE